MSPLATLTSLTPREAVTDAIHRLLRGIDHNDISIFNAAFAGEDVILQLNGDHAKTLNGISEIDTHVFNPIGPMDSTHMVSNVRVDLEDGADTASLTCFVLAQHCAPGKGREPDSPKFLVGAEYSVDLVLSKGEGLWKINKFVLDVVWNQGDPSVMKNSV